MTQPHPTSSQTLPIRAIQGGSIPARFFATRRTAQGFTPAALLLSGETIEAVDQELGALPAPGHNAETPATLDATGWVILPGFIDIHIHGAQGHDTMHATPAALTGIARFIARHGVTSFLPTTLTAPHAHILSALAAVQQTLPQTESTAFDGARILGAHLEGPYIHPDYPGAQSSAEIRTPDLVEFRACLDAGPVRLVTLAPEISGADALIREARARNIAVALGHSAATCEQALAAFDAGVTQTTHLYNAMTPLHHREPGAVGAALTDDRVYAQLIADTIHVHPAAIKIVARCKGAEKTILITDAMAAAGMGPGHYLLGDLPVNVKDGACRLESGALAGSLLTMDVALRHFMAATGLPLSEAWPATSLAPATALGLAAGLAAIAPGYRADLVLLDQNAAVAATIVSGRLVYLREADRLQPHPRA